MCERRPSIEFGANNTLGHKPSRAYTSSALFLLRRELTMPSANSQIDTGMHLRDLLSDEAFARRQKRSDPNRESLALRRLSRLFAEAEESVLQELVDTAVALCGADS